MGEDRESQRLISKRHGFTNDDVPRLRSAFKALNPNEEGLVLRDSLKALLVDTSQDNSNARHFAELQRDLTNGHPTSINFEVFVKFMKRKVDLGIARRTSVCVGD